ncbi:MAG: alanine--tRNA ligase-related protein, partial [Promethearchaeota archaeon]
GGYNLRVILRRALSFIDQFEWDLDLGEICEWHAIELKDLFPELLENVENVKKILVYEKRKYDETKRNVKMTVDKLLSKGKSIGIEKLLEFYDSKGISPELIRREAKARGIDVKVPENFYRLVSELHNKKDQIHVTKKRIDIDLTGLPETRALYFDDYDRYEATAKVLRIQDRYVVLDQTVAYPTSGGQLHDIGMINGENFVEAFKQGGIIVHVMEKPPRFKEGDAVTVKVDKSWRDQLSQHHTATHVINAAARRVLGSHVNQAGAKKTVKKAHLDITHYDSLSREEEIAIEQEANKIVDANLPIVASFLPRSKAEEKYGMDIYQGGAVPGKMIRIVNLGNGLDVEACGGTHLHRTGEIGKIKIIKSSKIQDGIVRIEFTAGPAADKLLAWKKEMLDKAAKILNVEPDQVPARGEELFKKWKKLKKTLKKNRKIEANLLKLTSEERFEGDALSEIARIFKTQPEHVPKNAEKFLREYEKLVERAIELNEKMHEL